MLRRSPGINIDLCLSPWVSSCLDIALSDYFNIKIHRKKITFSFHFYCVAVKGPGRSALHTDNFVCPKNRPRAQLVSQFSAMAPCIARPQFPPGNEAPAGAPGEHICLRLLSAGSQGRYDCWYSALWVGPLVDRGLLGSPGRAAASPESFR